MTQPTPIERAVHRNALKRAAEKLREAARDLQQAKAPALALRARHDAQECDARALEIEMGLLT